MREELPRAYGETRLVLLAVDPFHVHAYWEMTLEDRVAARERIPAAEAEPDWVLRFYDVTSVEFDGTNAHGTFDVSVQPSAQNWYVELWSADKTYFVELGLRRGAAFAPVCRSNVVHVPRATPSQAPPPPPPLGVEPTAAQEPAVFSREAPAPSAEPTPTIVDPAPEALELPSEPAPIGTPGVSGEEYARWRAEQRRSEEAASAGGGVEAHELSASFGDGTLALGHEARGVPLPGESIASPAGEPEPPSPSPLPEPSRSVSLAASSGSGSSAERRGGGFAGGSGGG